MPSYQTFGSIHGAGSLVQWCPLVVRLRAAAGGERSRLPKLKTKGPAGSHANRSLPVRTQVTKHRASATWRDIPPRVAKAESSLGRVPERLSELATDSLRCALSVGGIRRLRAAYRHQVGGSPRRPRTPARSRTAAQKLLKRPAGSPPAFRCPIRNGDRCAPGTSRRSASTFQSR